MLIIEEIMIILTVESNENRFIITRSCVKYQNRFLVRDAFKRIAWTSKWAIILKTVKENISIIIFLPDKDKRKIVHRNYQGNFADKSDHLCNHRHSHPAQYCFGFYKWPSFARFEANHCRHKRRLDSSNQNNHSDNVQHMDNLEINL